MSDAPCRPWVGDLETTDPQDGWLFLGVIEWASDSSAEPAVTVARTVEDIERWYRDRVAETTLDEGEDVPETPAADVPHAELVEWMHEVREVTTGAWLTIYRQEIPGANRAALAREVLSAMRGGQYTTVEDAADDLALALGDESSATGAEVTA